MLSMGEADTSNTLVGINKYQGDVSSRKFSHINRDVSTVHPAPLSKPTGENGKKESRGGKEGGIGLKAEAKHPQNGPKHKIPFIHLRADNPL